MDKKDKRYKVNNDQLKKLREERASGVSLIVLAELYKISYHYASMLCRGVARDEVEGPVGDLYLSENVIIKIREKRNKKAKVKDLATEFGLSQKHTSAIVTGKVHKDKKGIITNAKDLQFSRKDVVSIRKRREKGEKCKDLAAEYGVLRGAIENMVRGMTYKNYPGPIYMPAYKLLHFKEEDVIKMRKRHDKGEPCNDLAEEYGVSASSMNKILTGQKFAEFGGPVKQPKKRERLKKHVVVNLRKRHDEGERCADLAKEFRMPYGNMNNILNYKIYKHFPGPVRSKSKT